MMKALTDCIRSLFVKRRQRNVALVLGGGGARGFAHIGAIEVLLERGYNIASVAGTSMGALVGGLYAAGKLDKMKRIVLGLNRKKIISLIGISPGLDHIASGDKLKEILDRISGGVRIEQLPIDFCCSASDVATGEERVFTSGPLSEAIRASVSIPCFFAPVREGEHIYVDGSVHNTLPLDRVVRHKGDILVAVNVSAHDTHTSHAPENYVNMLLRVAQVSIQNNTRIAMKLTPPDICADIPMDSFGLLEFERAREIISLGRKTMTEQLDLWENES